MHPTYLVYVVQYLIIIVNQTKPKRYNVNDRVVPGEMISFFNSIQKSLLDNEKINTFGEYTLYFVTKHVILTEINIF